MPQSVAALLTVFNRKAKTLACLESLYVQCEAISAEGRYRFSAFMVDDGCTDGTSEAVRERFPQTHIIRTDGGLFWNQGMRKAWDEAAREDFDFYLLINDDITLADGALDALLENSTFLRHRAIVVGTTSNSSGTITYGGRTKSNKIVQPDPAIPVSCHMFNGNLVLIPKFVYEKVGNLSPAYQHSFGDYDYGVRARKLGIACVVAPGVLAVCERNSGPEKWRNATFPVRERLAYLKSPKGRPPKEQFIFDSRLKGLLYAVGHGISVLFKMLFSRKS